MDAEPMEVEPGLVLTSHAEIDFTFYDTLNGRELAQLICGTLSGRMDAISGGSVRFLVRIMDDSLAAVCAALVQAGWTVRQTEWGGAAKQTVLEASSE